MWDSVQDLLKAYVPALAASDRRFPSLADKTTKDFKRQAETRLTRTLHPVWIYI